MRNIYLFFVILSATMRSQTDTSAKYDFDRKYTVEQQRYDLKILKEALQKTHAGIYWYTTKEKFDKKFNSLYKNIDSEKTEYQFLLYFLPLLEQIHCSHPTANYQKRLKNTKQLI